MDVWAKQTIDDWALYWAGHEAREHNDITMSGLFILGKQLQEQTALLRALVDKKPQDPEDEFHD